MIAKVSPEGNDSSSSSETVCESIPTYNHIYGTITIKEIADEIQCRHFAFENGVDFKEYRPLCNKIAKEAKYRIAKKATPIANQ